MRFSCNTQSSHIASRRWSHIAGAVWGSPLANEADEKQLRWLTLIPGAECEKKDSKALETLSPANRDAWFAEHTLPEHIRYYSVVSFPDPENISNGLQRYHKKLGALKDARNDSQVVFYDQVIPGSTILGFFNADHWAMSVPIARQHEVSQAIFADENDFPREIALEAILRFIEEDLKSEPPLRKSPSSGYRPDGASGLGESRDNLGRV